MQEYLIAIIMLIPSAIVALGVWKIQSIVTKAEKRRMEQEKCREDYQFMHLRCTTAAIKLGKATAKALRDGHTNGEVSSALEYARKVEHEQESWIQEQGIKHVI